MSDSRLVDIGFVNNLTVIKKPGGSETLLIIGQSQSGRWARVMTRGAAQTLWFHLTTALYPRAAEQITHRAQTAVLRRSTDPLITNFFEVTNNETRKMLRVRGLGGEEDWLIYFTYEDGYELWASLEKILDVV
jgi:hypothetical protein